MALQPQAGGDLTARIVSGIVLALLALAGAWFGYLAGGIVVGVVAGVVYVEWTGITRTVH